MNERLLMEKFPKVDSDLRTRERALALSHFEILLRRTEYLYEEKGVDEQVTFAEYIDKEQEGFITITAEQLREGGINTSLQDLYGEVNKRYQEGGVHAVAMYILELSDELISRAGTREESNESDQLIRSNLVGHPLPQMEHVEGGRCKSE